VLVLILAIVWNSTGSKLQQQQAQKCIYAVLTYVPKLIQSYVPGVQYLYTSLIAALYMIEPLPKHVTASPSHENSEFLAWSRLCSTLSTTPPRALFATENGTYPREYLTYEDFPAEGWSHWTPIPLSQDALPLSLKFGSAPTQHPSFTPEPLQKSYPDSFPCRIARSFLYIPSMHEPQRSPARWALWEGPPMCWDIEETHRSPSEIRTDFVLGDPTDQALNILSNEDKVDRLLRLVDADYGRLFDLARDIRGLLGIFAKSNKKARHNILAKSVRPEILSDKPWFGVEHIRDSVRFKARLDQLEALIPIMRLFYQYGLSPVKMDFDKFLCSKEFGWRPIAVDLRFPSGLLVEFYGVPTDMDLFHVKSPNHLLFEKWRGKSPRERALAFREYASDTLTSLTRYTNALLKWNKMQGMQSLSALRMQFLRITNYLSMCDSRCHSCLTKVQQEALNGQNPCGGVKRPRRSRASKLFASGVLSKLPLGIRRKLAILYSTVRSVAVENLLGMSNETPTAVSAEEDELAWLQDKSLTEFEKAVVSDVMNRCLCL